MRNSQNNFLIPEPYKADPEVTTSLYVEEVPSEVAFDLLMGSMSKGKMATQEEIIERINNGETISITYEELIQNIKKMAQEKENALAERFLEQEENAFYEEVEEHQSSDWKVNPDNPNEEIQICPDCGAIVNRRDINLHSFVGNSNMNEELLRMLDEDDEREYGGETSGYEDDDEKDYGNQSSAPEEPEMSSFKL